MQLTEHAYIFYFGIPIVMFILMTTIAVKNNSRAFEHRLMAVSFFIYCLLFILEWIRHLVPLRFSAFINVWLTGPLLIIGLVLTVHVCAVLYTKNTQRPLFFPIHLLYGAVLIHIAIALSPLAPTASNFTREGIWIIRDAPFYSQWIFIFLGITMSLNIFIAFSGIQLSFEHRKARRLFLFLFLMIPINGFLYTMVISITPVAYLPSIPSLYMMVTLSVFILLGMQRYQLFPHYERRYMTMFENSPIPMFIMDERFFITEANELCSHYFQKDLSGRNLFEVLRTEENQLVAEPIYLALLRKEEIVNTHIALQERQGTYAHFVVDGNAISYRNEVYYYIMFRDRTIEVQQEQKIHQLAFYDSLTGIPNRTSFMLEAEKRFATGEDMAILLLDLNDFKLINDRYGHAAGDLILQLTGETLAKLAGDDHIPARLGGDEFVMYVSLQKLTEPVAQFVERMLTTFHQQTVIFEETSLAIKPSIGYAIRGERNQLKDVLHAADQHMYTVKQLYKQQHHSL